MVSLFFLSNMVFAQITIDPLIFNQLEEKNQKTLKKVVNNQFFASKTTNDQFEGYVVYEVLNERFAKNIPNFKRIRAEGFERYVVLSEKKRKIALQDQTMRTVAMKDVKQLLPKEISDSCSVTSVGFDYMKRNNDSVQVISSTVFLHRIVDGVPVRGGAFIQIEYDSNGILKQFDMYWPKYRRKKVRGYLSREDQMLMQKKQLNEMVKMINQDILEQGLPVKGELKKTYKTLKFWASDAGEKYLIPNVTYTGSYGTEYGKQPMIIDVPFDETLIPQENVFVYRDVKK